MLNLRRCRFCGRSLLGCERGRASDPAGRGCCPSCRHDPIPEPQEADQ